MGGLLALVVCVTDAGAIPLVAATTVYVFGIGFVFANTVAAAIEAARLYAQVSQSEQRYRQVLENVDEVIYMIEVSSDDPFNIKSVQFVSPHVEDILGFRPDEFIQDPALWSSLIHPDDLEAVKSTSREMYTNRCPITREYRMRHKCADEYRWLEDDLQLHRVQDCFPCPQTT